ncbi:MAG: F0F1 ATP synthase subunit delta [Sulfuricella sp.]|nr:F0F1 ATP synthase subunit delta [Sulfuricella sp.]
MERATLARPYAEAVGKLAAQGNTWEPWSQRLAILAAVAADEQMLALALNPAVDSARVAEVVLSICGGQLGQEGANLVHVLSENKRLPLVPEIVSLFEALKAAQEGELNAHVCTAYEMSAEQLASLAAKLETKFGRKINATQSVDADLIGGIVIQVGDEVMDASVRGGLGSLSVTLKA